MILKINFRFNKTIHNKELNKEKLVIYKNKIE